MLEIEETEKILLEEIQKDLPLTPNPFEIIGQRCGLTEKDTVQRIAQLISAGFIREISAILNAESIGYKSTLVAAQVRSDLIDSTAAKINAHPRVSHNYLRDHKFNMWFTLAAKAEESFQNVVKRLIDGTHVRFLILPAIYTFKIGVNFKLTGKSAHQGSPICRITGRKGDLTPIERNILDLLQDGIEIVPNPWQETTDKLQISMKELFTALAHLKETGVIKRISGVLRHRNIGFHANAMACFKLAEDNIVTAGRRAAEYPEVSHCYQRETSPDWNYPLFTMVHGRSRTETNSFVEDIAKSINSSDYIILYSLKELKKERIKYFRERSDHERKIK